ncbi:MAG: acyl carrier protein [Ginsengibacter sp.]
MQPEKIINDLTQIFKTIFEDDSISLNENTTTSDIESWDSLNHIHMITAVEKHFKIRFDLNELLNFKNIGDLCKGILEKIN